MTRLQPGDVVGDAALDPVLRPVARVLVDAGDVEVAVAARAVRVAPGRQVDRGAGQGCGDRGGDVAVLGGASVGDVLDAVVEAVGELQQRDAAGAAAG